MKTSLRRYLAPITPPLVRDLWRRYHPGIKFRGTFNTWEEARNHSSGYDAEDVLTRVREAVTRVRNGEAVCERDGVLFATPVYPFPLIAVLLRAACEGGGRLTVLDFGGALGSSYYQCRDFLVGVDPLQWHIVEQPAFVKCGQCEFETEVIRFFDRVEASVKYGHPDVVLISGVLQYLPDPSAVLAALAHLEARYIVVDRTPVAARGNQTITIQIVPEAINRSSYPTWLFNETLLKKPLLTAYEEIASFIAVDGVLGSGALKARFMGFIFQRQKENADWSR